MRRAVEIVVNLAMLGAIGYFIYEDIKSQPDEFTCSFDTSDKAPILPGIESGMRLDGTIDPAIEGEDLDVRSAKGILHWNDGDQSFAAQSNGSIFTDENGDVLGLHVYTSGPARGFQNFSIATLNEKGWLDEDRERVFVSRFPAEKKIYGASYRCDIDE